MDDSKLSPFWWLWIPVLIILAQLGIEIFVPQQYMAALHSEWGPHETFQSLIIGAAFILALRLLLRLRWQDDPLMFWWVLLACLCCFYVTGEELSWGQQILHWTTPDFWTNFNDQRETNLHNTSSWLDQKPRALLFIGIVIGGLIIPAIRRWRPDFLPVHFTRFYPQGFLSVPALGVLLPYLLQAVSIRLFHMNLFERVSEVQELYMYYFVLLYLVTLFEKNPKKQLKME